MTEVAPIETARVFVLDDSNRLLVLRRALGRYREQGTELPGGNREYGQTPDTPADANTAITGTRELLEETGLELAESELTIVGRQGPRQTSHGPLKVTDYYMTHSNCSQVKLSQSHDKFYLWSRPNIPYLGLDEIADAGNLNKLEGSWLTFYSRTLRRLIDHEAEVLPLAYFTAYHWIPSQQLSLQLS